MLKLSLCVRSLPLLVVVFFISACSTLQLDDVKLDAPEKEKAEKDLWVWEDGNESWVYEKAKKRPKVALESWQYEKNAIQLTIRAVQQLNNYDDRPHTLVLRFFQLSGPTAFEDMRKSYFGTKELFTADGDNQDPSIVSVEEIIIRPNDDRTWVFDRFAETRFIAIAAAYYDLNSGNVTRLVSFPAIDDTPKPKFGLLDAITFGYFAEDIEQLPRRPGKLNINLLLGMQEIEKMEITTL